MHLDVVGFSAMMGLDEDGTIDRIIALHAAVRDAVEAHGGSIAGTAGDSVLASFESVVDAVICAGGIQAALAAAEGPDGPPLQARIGIHLGDVIVEGDTVFGDGVNIAARLEQAADPGGILVSDAVHQQVKGKVDLPFESAGSRRLKNISEPIRVYRVSPAALGGRDAPPPPTQHRNLPAAPDVAESLASIGEVVRQATALARQQIEAAKRAGDTAAPSALPSASRSRSHDDLAETIDRVVRDRIGRGPAVRPRRRRSDPVVVAASGLVSLTIGGLLVVGWATGYSDSGWFLFLGSLVIGLWLGQLVSTVSGMRWLGSLIVASSIAVGAVGFGSPAGRAVAWVVAAALAARALKRGVAPPAQEGWRSSSQ
jgi:hypothetical protein